ncbi:MAG: sigma-70 family RNA polymerase sigma factor [Chitinophagaceae bacterium]|nr:sigma-70 family RNA polymerase sigma factor [Chitinophagaceae bacterium]
MGESGPDTDEELLKRYQQTGDQHTLAVLYLRYTDLVYGTALKYLKEPESAKDTVMVIYQELVEKLPRHNIGHFRPWLHTVVKNHCLMRLRKEKKTITVEFQPNFMQSEDFTHLDEVLDREKELQKLEGCIKALQEQQQTTIRLFYLEGKCYNEIMELTGFDWNKVRSLVQNGRRNLKNCMEKK